ncbi:DUF3108 domain-containing protein [Massilia horti]|uniref:DUF3108 domain-containing protein n=1 Tax=Massilia horti TaxID=2562153 RepID=A0A4Y9SW46_9BURK|nr:DUF3108 domain-containing protein [Massilia horti]TFW30821.1 DUF3108 domain-containing protein [Massilia horti]
MSDVPLSARPGRALVLGAAIVLLHWLVLRWLGAQVEAPRERHVEQEAVTLLAQLPAPQPKVPDVPPPRLNFARVPVPQVPPPPDVRSEALAEPVAPTAQPADAATGAVDAPSGTHADLHTGAAAAPAGVESAQAEPAPEARVPHSYKTDMPPPAEITLDVARVDADGTRWSGEALLSWKRSGDNYQINIEAGIRIVFARVNLVTLSSEGTVTEAGLAPLTMTEKRRGRSLTATHFNRQAGTITFSASQNSYPLVAGAQDKASIPIQLAAIARGDPDQLAGDIDILVGEDRDASVFRFVVLGQETIDTRMGKLQTWHLSRPPKPGSYNSRLDIWLAPGRGWYPVQIRNTEASGAVTTQTVNKIVMTDTGS